jgi:hypothetical protein
MFVLAWDGGFRVHTTDLSSISHKWLTASLSLQELLRLSQEMALRIVTDTTSRMYTNQNRFFQVDHLTIVSQSFIEHMQVPPSINHTVAVFCPWSARCHQYICVREKASSRYIAKTLQNRAVFLRGYRFQTLTHTKKKTQLATYLKMIISQVSPRLRLSRCQCGTLYPQKLALTSLTSGGRSVSIVR